MLYYVDYISHKGGVNNLQVVCVTLNNGKKKTFTSLHKMAEKRARNWIKKQESVKYYFVNWEDGGYKVSAHGSTAILQLKNTVQDLEVGKTEALRLGKKLLKKAFEELGETQ